MTKSTNAIVATTLKRTVSVAALAAVLALAAGHRALQAQTPAPSAADAPAR